jgi:hypothetical protein
LPFAFSIFARRGPNLLDWTLIAQRDEMFTFYLIGEEIISRPSFIIIVVVKIDDY